MNEFEIIDRFFRRPPGSASVVLGVGDDAALLRPTAGAEIVATVDMLVEGRHFFADVDPEALGHKTLAVNLSDIAAMGAIPRWALLAGALPDNDALWLERFSRGFLALADAFGVDLVGGDTTRGPLNLCVTLLGEVPAGQAIRRSGAAPGDAVYVSGVLGGAALALAAMNGLVELGDDDLARCRKQLERPVPRVALGQRLRGIATAMLDISDGLTGDLQHIMDASGVGAVLDLKAIPRPAALGAMMIGDERRVALQCLLAGGDDYELCFTAPESAAADLAQIAAELALPLTAIGEVVAIRHLVIHDERGEPIDPLPRAFDHFAAAPRR